MSRPVEASVEDPRLELGEGSVERLFHFLDTLDIPWSVAPGTLAVAFVGESRCAELHEAFFGDESVTDVMTFPGDPEDGHAGDLAICPAHAARQAPAYQQTFAEELTLYLVHGWLHLAGLDDREEEAIRAMRAAEDDLMRRIRAAGCTVAATWRD